LCKIRDRRTENVLPRVGLVPVGGAKVAGKGVRKVNMVQKLLHMYINAEMIPVETIPGMRGGEIKETSGGGEFKYI
jgi:hypothetical protein